MHSKIALIFLFTTQLCFSSEFKRNWQIILIPHTHLDIGYTHAQEEVFKIQWNHIYKAMDLIEKGKDLPREAQFAWSPEAMYTIESFLDQASESDKERFYKHAKSGHIGLDGLFANLLVGLNRPEELRQALSYKEKLQNKIGMPIDSVMITDVPGWSWSLPEVLSNYGIKYLSLGPNCNDRVGFTVKDWGDRPFYWVSPSGAKVLTFVHGKGYHYFHGKRISLQKKILSYLKELEEKNYPYDIIPIRYAIGADNGPPDENISSEVLSWNKAYPNAQIRITTTSIALKEFENIYGDKLPSIAGEFSPYWTDGAASTARETAMARNAAEELDQAQTLFSLINSKNFPFETFHTAWNEILLFSEHTWGAHTSIKFPNSRFVKSQWEWKKQRAQNAKKLSSNLLVKSFALNPSDQNYITVFNTHSWPVSGPVVMDGDAPISVSSLDGETVKAQMTSDKKITIMSEQVPPLGSKTYLISKKSPQYFQNGCVVTTHSISNGVYKIELDTREGFIKSILSLKDGREYVNQEFPDKFNEYIYISGKNPRSGRRNTLIKRTSFEILENGPLVCSLKISRRVIGSKSLETIITLRDSENRIDIENILDRPSRKRKEGIHFSFPVKAKNPKVRYDVAWGSVDLSKDLMEGTNKNYFTPLRWVDVSGDEQGMMIVLHDAPLFESGEITMDVPGRNWTPKNWNREVLINGTVYSFVMNNYWHTNFKADQPGLTSFRYTLYPHLKYDVSENMKRSLEAVQPLQGVKGSNSSAPIFALDNHKIIIESVKYLEHGEVEIVLFNTSDAPQVGELKSAECKNLVLLHMGKPYKKNVDEPIILSKHEMKRILCNSSH